MKRNINLLIGLSILSIFLLIGLRFVWFNYHSTTESNVAIQEGILKIDDKKLIEGKYIPLSGNWLFYDDQFIDPGATTSSAGHQWIHVPGSWGNYKEEVIGAASYGKGSYQLFIHLPDDFDQTLALRFHELFSAANIYANGELVYTFNETDHQFEDRGLIRGPFQVDLPADDKVINLVLHVANYQFPLEGGITRNVYLGDKQIIDRQSYFANTIQIVVSFTFFLHAIYGFIILFIVRHRRKELFLFAILLTLFGTGILLDDEVIIDLPLSISEAQRLLLFIFISTLFTMFRLCCSLFKITFQKIKPNLFYIITALLTFLFPYTYYQYWVFFMYAVFLIVIVYMVYRSIRNVREGNTDTLFVLLFLAAYASNAFWGALIKANIYPMPFYPLDFLLSMIFIMMLFFKQHADTLKANRQYTKQLVQNELKKDEFLANTAHELRNPLNGITVILESILSANDGRLSLSAKNNLYLALEVAYNMKYTLNDLQDISRLKDHQIKLNVKNVNLHQLTQNIADVFRLYTEGKSIEIRNEVPVDFPDLLGDEQRLFQILFNLVGNAAKYTREGTVIIQAKHHGKQATITVADTGIGIPPKELANIMMPYERGSNLSSYGEFGVGLGLSISKELVRLHGGELTIDSNLGKGTSVTFKIDISQQAETKAEATRDALPNRVAERRKRQDSGTEPLLERILVIDDDPINLKALEIALSHKYDLTILSNPKEIFQMNNLYRFSLVISDVMMPQMSGYELTKKLRKRYTITDLPILLLTALNHPSNIAAGFSAGANDYISKPVEHNELISRVDTLVHLKLAIKEKITAEAAWLQAQIKPHFLFNTLNAIASLGTSNTDQMIDLIHEFGEYLSKTFDSQSTAQFVPLEHELKIVKSFVHIQSMRFLNQFEVHWHLNPSNKKIWIPPFVLQTLVENAIQHGALKTPEDKGRIDIYLQVTNGKAWVTVKDNGPGIHPHEIQNLFMKPSDGIGLYNADQRLKMLSGEGLTIQARSPHGTTVKFNLPVGEEPSAFSDSMHQGGNSHCK